VVDDLINHLDDLAQSNKEFSVKDATVSFTLDCLASSGLGFEANSFKDPDNIFTKKVGIETNTELTIFRFIYRYFPQVLKEMGEDGGHNPIVMIKSMFVLFCPQLAKLMKLSFCHQDLMEFFGDVVKKMVAHRQKDRIRRNDLIDHILEIQRSQEEAGIDDSADTNEYKIPEDELESLLVANVIILFFSGFDTTSSALSLAIGYLAKNQDVQEKLFQEINDAIVNNGVDELDYETIQTLPYLDKVIMETLRIYFSNNIERECTKDYKLPGSSFVIPKGMLIIIPASGFHRDGRYFPDPDNFNPDNNFSEQAKANRPSYSFLPFGQGPRACIGIRFALLMAKACLVKVVGTFRLLEGSKMPRDFVLDPSSFTGMPEGGVWCKAERR
jgi:cytochrome P450 family 6